MLELAKTGGLVAVAVVSAVFAYDALDHRYYGMERIIVAVIAVGLAAVTGLPANRTIPPNCVKTRFGN